MHVLLSWLIFTSTIASFYLTYNPSVRTKCFQKLQSLLQTSSAQHKRKKTKRKKGSSNAEASDVMPLSGVVTVQRISSDTISGVSHNKSGNVLKAEKAKASKRPQPSLPRTKSTTPSFVSSPTLKERHTSYKNVETTEAERSLAERVQDRKNAAIPHKDMLEQPPKGAARTLRIVGSSPQVQAKSVGSSKGEQELTKKQRQNAAKKEKMRLEKAALAEAQEDNLRRHRRELDKQRQQEVDREWQRNRQTGAAPKDPAESLIWSNT